MQPFNAQLVVDLLLEFYTTLINLSYLSPSTLILPPHTISEQEVQRFIPTMDPVVLDLIKRLPYLKNVPLTGGQEIGPGIRSHNLLAHLWFAQNPMEMDGDAKEEAGDYVEPWSVVLTDGYQGTYMVLNTRTGTITEVDWESNSNQPEGASYYYYNHQPAYPAEDVLREWIRRYVTLEWIPWSGLQGWQGILREDDPSPDSQQYYHVLKFMYLNHGWPNAFRRDEFAAALQAFILQEKARNRPDRGQEHGGAGHEEL